MGRALDLVWNWRFANGCDIGKGRVYPKKTSIAFILPCYPIKLSYVIVSFTMFFFVVCVGAVIDSV